MHPPICYLKLWKCESVIGGGLPASRADSDLLVESKSFCMIIKCWLLVLSLLLSLVRGKKRDKTARLSFAFLFNAPLWGMLCIPLDVTDEEGEEGKGLHSVWRRAALWVKQRKRETNKRLLLGPLATTFLALLKVLQLPVYFLLLQPTLCIWPRSPPVACRHRRDLGFFLIIWGFQCHPEVFMVGNWGTGVERAAK